MLAPATAELDHLDDAGVYERLRAAERAMSKDLLRDPVTLARGIDRTYRMRPHLKLIGEALLAVERGEFDRLLIITPPQVGKSTTVAEWAPYWWLCVHPEDKIAVTSYSDDLALKRGKAIRSYVEEYGDEYGLRMRAGSGAMQDWEVTAGGGVRSVSVGKGLTGHSVNLLIVDDPHKDRADAESEASRRAVHDWYSSTALKRLQPDRNAVVAIMTRWHPDDFAGRRLEEEGRVEDGGRWKVIHLPAVADPAKFGPDPLGREQGEPLPHPKIPTKDKKRLKAWWADMKATSIVRDWHALAQGDPQPAEGAPRKEKISRWTRPVRPQTPTEPTQFAMAAVLEIPLSEVRARTWPDWLLLGLLDHSTVWELPWTPEGTMQALDDAGRLTVDRRGFLTAGAGTVAGAIAQWAIAVPATANDRPGRRIGTAVADRFDNRLDELRHLDDDLGADHVYEAARVELRLINRLLRNNSYSTDTGRRLHASAAEASRLAGWCAYDIGNVEAAEKHLHAALRASANSGDHATGAIVAAFWANVRYGATTPDPHGALDLIDGALVHRTRIESPRVMTMLHIRRARAHSLAGEPTAAYRAIDDALAAYANGIPAGDDLPAMYWINAGEIHQAAASAALSLGDPARALRHFTAAATDPDPYDEDKEPRGAAIYVIRQASAYLAMGDLDATVETGKHAVDLMGGVSSARGGSALAELRADLAKHRSAPVVSGFLDDTA